MLNLTFDHNQPNLLKAVGITQEAHQAAAAKIMFHTIGAPFLVESHYGVNLLDEDPMNKGVPASYVSTSGVLERCLRDAHSVEEQVDMLLGFERQHKVGTDLMSLYITTKRRNHITQILKDTFSEIEGVEEKIAEFMEKSQELKALDEVFEYVRAADGSFEIFASLIPDGINPVQFLLEKLKSIDLNK